MRDFGIVRFQFGILKRGLNIKYLPYVFTQEGSSTVGATSL